VVMTNSRVRTPLGVGIVQGAFTVTAGNDAVVGVLVRLPINETTRPCLSQSNCMTPRAEISGLWVFEAKELSA
jgi:hypothetical protein